MAGKRNGSNVKAKDVDRTGLNERGKKTLAMLSLLEDEDKMSDWEKTFVVDISDRFIGKQWSLTQPQYDCLERIYNKFN